MRGWPNAEREGPGDKWREERSGPTHESWLSVNLISSCERCVAAFPLLNSAASLRLHRYTTLLDSAGPISYLRHGVQARFIRPIRLLMRAELPS